MFKIKGKLLGYPLLLVSAAAAMNCWSEEPNYIYSTDTPKDLAPIRTMFICKEYESVKLSTYNEKTILLLSELKRRGLNPNDCSRLLAGTHEDIVTSPLREPPKKKFFLSP